MMINVKKNRCCCLAASLVMCLLPSTTKAQHIDQATKDRAASVVRQMTLDEKIDYLSGETSFSWRAIPRLGIPRILLADGAVGIRNHAPKSTLYPASVLSAATWNRQLIYRLGESLGDDARARGVGVLLAPGVNITRYPLCGRNYEYFGEDPYLTGEVAVQYIRGVQHKGVMAVVKHFAGNNQEWSRHHVNSEIDRRTLHEIYLPAFRKAVTVAGVGAVMDSYNLLNGVHSTENAYLNKDVLRKQWGFEGIVMSDWTSVYSTIAAANNGLDMEMPKGKNFSREKLKEAIAAGTVSLQTIDEKVQHIMQTLMAFGLTDRVQKDSTLPLDYAKSRQTALELAREGIVLLKNEDRTLPLRGTVAILGPNADVITTGGGSGAVVPFGMVTAAQALKQIYPNTIMLTDDVIYKDIRDEITTDEKGTVPGFSARYFANKTMEGKAVLERIDKVVDFDWQYKSPDKSLPDDGFSAEWTAYYTPKQDETVVVSMAGDDGYKLSVDGKTVVSDWGNHSYSDRETALDLRRGHTYKIVAQYFDNSSSAIVKLRLRRLDTQKLEQGLRRASRAVVVCGFNSSSEGEGFDRPFALPHHQQYLIDKAAQLCKHTTVVINAGGGVEMAPWIGGVKGVIMAWYPGQEGGRALAEVLTGQVVPSGKLPITIDAKLEDNPCHNSYYVNTDKREVRTVEYTEGLFSGYRGYDRLGRTPLFPFGYGLSYTTFDYSDLQVVKTGANEVAVTFNVRNTGKVKAKETAQLYLRHDNADMPRPLRELKGFDKVELRPGESKRVTITLNADAFSHYDDSTEKWVVSPGNYHIMVGASSRDIRLEGNVAL